MFSALKSIISFRNQTNLRGRFFYYLIPKNRRKLLSKNIDIVYELKTKEEKMQFIFLFSSYLYMFFSEFIKWMFLNKKPRVVIKGKRYIDDAIEQRKSIFLLSPHIGHWEMALPIAIEKVTKKKLKTYCIRKTLKPNFLYRRTCDRFKQYGIEVIPPKGAARKVKREIEKNILVVYVHDQMGNTKGSEYVPFFGKKTYTYSSLADIYKKHEIIILPVYTYMQNKKIHVIEFMPEIRHKSNDSVYEMTKKYNQIIEKMILKHPTQWYGWIHDRWKYDH